MTCSNQINHKEAIVYFELSTASGNVLRAYKRGNMIIMGVKGEGRRRAECVG